MVRTPRSTQRSLDGVTEHGPFPWLLAVFVLGMLFAVGYSIDNDKSLSERNGVVTQTDADNDVIPSLAPTQD